MKYFNKKIAFATLSLIFIVAPTFAFADYYSDDYGYDDYSWDSGYGYDDYSWDSGYGYDDYSWDSGYGYDDYSWDSGYGYDDYSWDSGYGYDDYSWDSGYGYDDYSWDSGYGYDDYSWDSGYGYDDYSWDSGYGYDDYSWDSGYGYDDYSWDSGYGYDDYSWENDLLEPYSPQNDGYYANNQDYYPAQDYYQNQDYGYYQDYAYNDDYYSGGQYSYGGNNCYDDCYNDYDYCDYYDCDDDDYDYCDDHDCNDYDDLDVICTVSDRTIESGDSVTFTADADGGRGSYTYRWSGDVSGSSRSITERFTREGSYRGTVRVTDRDGRTATASCDTVLVEDEDNDGEDFDAVCKVSDTSIEKGDTVRFTAEVDGGDSPFDYDWSGDADSDDRTFSKRFTRTGTYEVDLKVTDDEGRVARDTCTVRVEDDNDDDDDDDDRDINVSTGRISSNTGNLAGVSSVYLNQVPYTGPEDVAKGIAFGVGILAWSLAGALIIRNKMNKKSVSSRIEAFKEMNRNTK